MLTSFATANPLPISHGRHHHNHPLSSFLPTLPPLFRPPTSTSPLAGANPKPISAAGSDNPPSRLILPNSPQTHSDRPPPKLIIPSSGSSSFSAASPASQNFYQPFRPPPSPLPPKYRNLDTAGRIEVLSNRLGIWYEYAPLISALFHEGFTPPNIEELTGITGVEQNRIVVASQVRQSLADPNSPSSEQLEPELLSYFDNGGAEVLYEIRLLTAAQRAASARYIVNNGFDGKGARDLARSVKDFPMRRGEHPGWDNFDYNLPGDCLSFMYFRQAREHGEESPERQKALKMALKAAESDRARRRVKDELERRSQDEEVKEADRVAVPVVRLMVGEVAEATTVVLLPSCKAEDKDSGVVSAPFDLQGEGEFGVVESDKEWRRWVALPGWDPLVGIGNSGGVVVEFSDAKVLPWRADKWYTEEAILVVADRKKKEVTSDDAFYLTFYSGEMKVKKGEDLKKMGVEDSLGMVVLVVRPPREDNNDPSDHDWD